MVEEEKKKMSKAEAGRLGGQKTKEKYGTSHYEKLGAKASDRLKKMWQQFREKQ